MAKEEGFAGFENIVRAPVDGLTYLFHVSGEKAVIYRVRTNGTLSLMWCGDSVEAFREILRRHYPEADVQLNDSDRAGPRTMYGFNSWQDFCNAYNSDVLSKKKVIAEHIWMSTRQANGLVQLVDDKLIPTDRGLAADATEVPPEEHEEGRG